jgi:hypothetical protein
VSRVESGLLAPDEAFARACDQAFPAAGGWFARFDEAHAKWDTAMPPAFRSFVTDEARATALYVFEHSLIPGLLATEDYSRAVLSRHPGVSAEQVIARVAARIARQAILDREDPPLLWVVIDDAALSRCVGSPDITWGALGHLADMARRPNITVQVLADAGAHIGLTSAFTIAEIAGATGSVNVDDVADKLPSGSSSGTRVLYKPQDLMSLLRADSRDPDLIIQEHIPVEQSEDWYVTLYCDANSECRVLFTGLKVRSWPSTAGGTACGYSIDNPSLALIAKRLCKELRYTGVADLDWRLDLRDGQYKLIDFNPRMGNQFRGFETEAGIDVVRALHLDLTGRDVPSSPQVGNRRIVIEHVDIPARIVYWRLGRLATSARPAALMRRPKGTSTELAWLAADDPLPVLAVLSRVYSLVKIIRGARLFPSLSRKAEL